MRAFRPATAVAIAVASLLSSCGGGGGGSYSAARFCAAEDEFSQDFTNSDNSDPTHDPEVFADLKRIREEAPAEIKADMDVWVSGFQKADRDRPADFHPATKRIGKVYDDECSTE